MFSSCHERGTKKKFWVPIRNPTSDLRIQACFERIIFILQEQLTSIFQDHVFDFLYYLRVFQYTQIDSIGENTLSIGKSEVCR